MDIMQAIFEIEKKASGIAESADELKLQQGSRLDSEIKAKEEEYQKNLSAYVEKLRVDANKKCEDSMKHIEEKYRKKLEDIEKKGNENIEKWSEAIFKAVINSK